MDNFLKTGIVRLDIMKNDSPHDCINCRLFDSAICIYCKDGSMFAPDNQAIDITTDEDLEYSFMSDSIGGRFGRVSLIGEGAYAKVWEAVDYETRLYYAIKEYSNYPLSEHESDQLLSMCEDIGQLQHPNLASVSGGFYDNGIFHLVMPYFQRGSLKTRGGNMPEKDLWYLALDIAKGLDCLHSNGYIHKDIKPENILISDDGKYVLSDFDISVRDSEPSIIDPNKTWQLSIYISPELYKDTLGVSPSSDVWSLGAVLLKMACYDTPPHEIETFLESTDFYQEMQNRYSNTFISLLRACLNSEPILRPSARTIADMAQNILSQINSQERSFY